MNNFTVHINKKRKKLQIQSWQMTPKETNKLTMKILYKIPHMQIGEYSPTG